MTNETVLKDLRGQAPRLLLACLIESNTQALQAACEVAGLAHHKAALRDRKRRLPWQELELFTRLGLDGIGILRTYGGAQISHVILAEVFRVICAADPAFGQISRNQFGLLNVIDNVVSPTQERKPFRDTLDGHQLTNAGPERNTRHTLELKARVRHDGDGYRVSGEKSYSTGALFAHWVTIKAVDEKECAVMLFVERGAPSLRIVDDWPGFGQRTTASGMVLLDEVSVTGDMLIHNGLLAEIPNLQDAVPQPTQATIDTGVAQAALDDAQAFVRECSRPWTDAQVEHAGDELYSIAEVGRLQIELHAVNALLRRAGWALGRMTARPVDTESVACASIAVAEARVLNTEISLTASGKLFGLASGHATFTEFSLDRHWRNARTHTLHNPVRWKVHAAGGCYLNGAHPACHS